MADPAQASTPASKRERLRNLLATGHIHGTAASSSSKQPPRQSQPRNNLPPGLSSIRSPSLRPNTEDVHQDELPDDVDIEFLSLDNNPKYDEPDSYQDDDEDGDLTLDEEGQGDDDHDSDEDDMRDWPEDTSDNVADEAVHIEGVPRSNLRLEAKQYKQPGFSAALLKLLRDDLKVHGWAELGQDIPTSQMNVHKVSGSLTNAVFFISFPRPETAEQLSDSVNLPPTVLLRIYGPSSGNLISRKKELHVLYTLSASYAIGPAIFGTFSNGRVEEYFESRALYKEEMRDPRTSRWIARRMRELHGVDLTLMELPPDPTKSPNVFTPSRKGSLDFSSQQSQTPSSSYSSTPGLSRPGFPNFDSSASGSNVSNLSTSSASSIFSVSSSYSSSSGSTLGGFSPRLTARSSSRPGVSEGSAPKKKRSLSSIGSRNPFSLEGDKWKRPKSVIWQNVESWTKEARKVLKKVNKLEELLNSSAMANKVPEESDILTDVNPLLCPSFLKEAKKRLDLKRFNKEVKAYKKYIEKWEAANGKSKRVFAHNDAQCGNLLRLTPGGKDEMVPGLRVPHEMIIVVDFEYAGVNPRGLDIANHFLEWQTDYHHPTLSHSVTRHGRGPSMEERQRFYRAYVPCDGGFDHGSEPSVPPLFQDDNRVQRLEDEVRLWTAASHAMYTVWSIVQATDDIIRRIEGWLDDPASAEETETIASKLLAKKAQNGQNGHGRNGTETDLSNGRPRLQRGKSGEEIVDHAAAAENGGHQQEQEPEIPILGDFDYMGYALERIGLFREEIQRLGI